MLEGEDEYYHHDRAYKEDQAVSDVTLGRWFLTRGEVTLGFLLADVADVSIILGLAVA
jgi:hypothetical protein